jgi:hypothetical protein
VRPGPRAGRWKEPGIPEGRTHGSADHRPADPARLERQQVGQDPVQRTRRLPEVGDAAATVVALEEALGRRDREEQGVGVAGVLDAEADPLELPRQLRAGVPMAGVDRLVVGAADPVVGRHADQQDASRPEHPLELVERRQVVLDAQVIEDVEAGDEVEALRAERERAD